MRTFAAVAAFFAALSATPAFADPPAPTRAHVSSQPSATAAPRAKINLFPSSAVPTPVPAPRFVFAPEPPIAQKPAGTVSIVEIVF